MIARYPGMVPAGVRSDTLQCQVDYGHFLSAAGIEVPGVMQGHNQLDVWRGDCRGARLRAGREPPQPNHRAPAHVGHRSLQDHGLSHAAYGELFDLKRTPASCTTAGTTRRIPRSRRACCSNSSGRDSA